MLALSQARVQVLAGDATGAQPAEVPGLPDGLKAALGGEIQPDYLVALTLSRDGKVFATAEIPQKIDVAAILRY